MQIVAGRHAAKQNTRQNHIVCIVFKDDVQHFNKNAELYVAYIATPFSEKTALAN